MNRINDYDRDDEDILSSRLIGEQTMIDTDQERLASIRTELLMHEANGVDTSYWHDTFFLRLLSRRDKRIAQLERQLKDKK